MPLFVESFSQIELANNLLYGSNLDCASESNFTYVIDLFYDNQLEKTEF